LCGFSELGVGWRSHYSTLGVTPKQDRGLEEERCGGLRLTKVRRGPSRSKDALRMTARTNNGKNNKGKCGGPSTAQQTMRPSVASVGMTVVWGNEKPRFQNRDLGSSAKAKYGDSGYARMTTLGAAANDGAVTCARMTTAKDSGEGEADAAGAGEGARERADRAVWRRGQSRGLRRA